MSRSIDATVLLVEGDRERAGEYARWLDDCEVRAAVSHEDVLDALDGDVDVVLLDGSLTDPSSEELLEAIRARRVDCQVGLLSGTSVSADVFRLDFDEYVPRPIGREEFRETVEYLTDRRAVMDVVETYLTLVIRKRRLEDRRDAEDLSEDDRYSELVGELVGRRHQITTLLSQLTEDDGSAADGSRDGPDEAVGPGGRSSADPTDDVVPLYRTRRRGFYAAWFAAALTYGVGDVVSTVYAVLTVPGLIEGNPVVSGILELLGLPGFVLLKLVVFLALISVSAHGGRTHDRFSYYWPPVVMAGLGLLLTGWNLRLILGA